MIKEMQQEPCKLRHPSVVVLSDGKLGELIWVVEGIYLLDSKNQEYSQGTAKADNSNTKLHFNEFKQLYMHLLKSFEIKNTFSPWKPCL